MAVLRPPSLAGDLVFLRWVILLLSEHVERWFEAGADKREGKLFT